jgi:hypothetical protein
MENKQWQQNSMVSLREENENVMMKIHEVFVQVLGVSTGRKGEIGCRGGTAECEDE